MTLGITAHRDITLIDGQVILSSMRDIIRSNSDDVIVFGGAVGGDTLTLRGALRFRTGTSPKLVVVVPDTLSKQPARTYEYTKLADSIIELRRPITKNDGFRSYRGTSIS